MKKQLIKTIIFLFIANPFYALANIERNQLPEGTVLNISATKTIEVENDLLTASLRFETEGKNPKDIQSKINEVMNKSIDTAKKYSKIMVSTEQYSVYQFYINKKDEQKVMWRGSQTIVVSGKSYDDILEITGKLQEMGLIVNNLSYTISNETREEIRDSLMESVIEKLMKKAQRASKAMGKENIKIIDMNIDDSATSTFSEARFSLSSDSFSSKMMAPVAASGKSQISVMGTAKILIKD